jgi:2',3'-cyclic-nucleotide 2'-phosphodiesterase (5'-nucleotidase family)
MALSAMKSIGYGAVNVGPYETLSPQPDDWSSLISSNVVDRSTGQLVASPYRILHSGDLTLGVVGIAPEGRISQGLPVTVLKPGKALESVLPEVRSKADLVILMSQYTVQQTESILQGISGVDLAIASSGGASGKPVITAEGVRIVPTATGCARLQTLTIVLDDTSILDVSKETIALEGDVFPDPDIVKITGADERQTLAQAQKAEMDMARQQVRELSTMNPMDYILKMQQEQDPEETRIRLERQSKIKEP